MTFWGDLKGVPTKRETFTGGRGVGSTKERSTVPSDWKKKGRRGERVGQEEFVNTSGIEVRRKEQRKEKRTE